MLASLKTWWNRPCGGKEVMAIAWPMVISTGSFSITMFVDRMLLLWHSAEEMSAAMPSGMLYWTMICFPFGIAQYVTTFVAQYVGAERLPSVGKIVWQGVYVAAIATPFFALMWPLAPWLFDWFDHPAAVQPFEINYFRTLLFCAPAGIAAGALSGFFIGRGETRIVMYANIIQTVINLGLDYILIFGVGPAPELGIVGAGIASVVSIWIKTGIYVYMMHARDNTQTYRLDQRRFDFSLIQRLFRYGGANGLHMVVEAGAFSLVLMFLGQLGTQALAATTLAFTVNSVAFIPMIGVSLAVTTMVGQEIMRGEADLAARATWTALVLAMLYSGLFGLMYVLCPDLFLLGHKAGTNAAEFAEIRETTIVLLRFVAAFCIFDSLQIIFIGAIKGAGDTFFVLMNTLIVSPLLVTVGWVGAKYFGGKLFWWWAVMTGWIFLLGVVYSARFLQGKWRTMSVIEPT